jgi:5'-deoxynucleotidase YfbR-like HD superfamily hydrolase
MHDPEQTADAMINVGRLALDFGRVDRITYHPDGQTPESDTDHTVMLGLVACAIAVRHFPLLNVGLIAQYALVHDLVETYAGDTPTLQMLTAVAKAEKQAREHAAFERIIIEFGTTLPWLPLTIGEYEAKALPEARFVKALDKLLPKVTHMLNGAVTIQKQGMSRADLAARLGAEVGEIKTYADDFPELFDVYAVLAERLLAIAPESSTLAGDQ